MIEPKVMAVLLMLAERAGEVVTRQQFIESIWAREYGGDESLTRAVSHLRKIFGDARGVHTHIETVPKTGYMLIEGDRPVAAGAVKPGRRALMVAAIVALLVVILVSVLMTRQTNNESPYPLSGNPGSVVLAVLPFDSNSSVNEDVSLAYGLTDEILSTLSQSQDFSVIAGNSTFQLIDGDKNDLKTLARQLNISHVIDGLVQRSPDGLKVGVRLIDAKSGQVVWSDIVERAESEIYMIPKMVATAVQTALGTETPEIRPRANPPDPLAYEAYLQSKALLRLPWGPNLSNAIQYLEDIVEMDASLSEAWATLALARLDMLFVQPPGDPSLPNTDPPQRLQSARHEANSALAVDPDSIEALLALAIIDRREKLTTLAESVNQLRSLLATAPNHPRVNMRMGLLMAEAGRFQQASRYLGRAAELDPLSNLPGAFYTDSLLSGGRFDEAKAFMDQRKVYFYYQRTYTGFTMDLLARDFSGVRKRFTKLDRNVVFGHTGLIPIESINVDSPNTDRLSQLISRLVTVAEKADPASDPGIAADLVEVADKGLMQHFHVVQFLAAAGLNEAAVSVTAERIMLGDTIIQESGVLLRPAFRTARHDQSIMELFDLTGQLDYWLKTGNWPDYCAESDLPYDCQVAAQQFREAKHL